MGRICDEVLKIPCNNRKFVSAVAIFLGLALTSCPALSGDRLDKPLFWPPDAVRAEAHSNLAQRRDAMEAVVLKINTSPYVGVILSESGGVRMRRADGEGNRWDELEDSDAWRDLLAATGFNNVLRHKDQVHFFHLPPILKEYRGISFNHMYIRSDKKHSPDCVPDFAEHRCGQCALNLDSGWIIQFGWLPPELFDHSEDVANACIQDFISATGVTFGEIKGN